MRLYLWQAGAALGVTDDDSLARRRAARALLQNGAARAVVEPAVFDDAVRTLTTGYLKVTGLRWTGYRAGSQVIWACYLVGAPGPVPLRAAS